MIGDEQAGIRSSHFTLDHIFELHAVIYYYRYKKKAFYLINRSILWLMLIATNINGIVLNAIYNLQYKIMQSHQL